MKIAKCAESFQNVGFLQMRLESKLREKKADIIGLYPSTLTEYRLWDSNRLAYRKFGANLTDESCVSMLPCSNEYVWEVFVHLMNQGNDQRAQIRWILLDFAVPVKEKTFIEFFR